jgi:hypothetical protein
MDVTIIRPDHETVSVNRTTLAARIDCAKALIDFNLTDRYVSLSPLTASVYTGADIDNDSGPPSRIC